MTGATVASPASSSFRSRLTGTVSQLRNKSIQTVESTRITGHLLTDRAHVVVRRNYSLANQRENISLLAASDELSQGEVHSLPLRAGFRQPHDLFDKAVVKHNIRTHHTPPYVYDKRRADVTQTDCRLLPDLFLRLIECRSCCK